MLWVLIRSISERCFQWVSTTYVFMKKWEKNIQELSPKYSLTIPHHRLSLKVFVRWSISCKDYLQPFLSSNYCFYSSVVKIVISWFLPHSCHKSSVKNYRGWKIWSLKCNLYDYKIQFCFNLYHSTDDNWMIFFLFFQENRHWQFMQIVSLAYCLSLFSGKNKKKFKMSSENFTQHAKC